VLVRSVSGSIGKSQGMKVGDEDENFARILKLFKVL
jgi:hypothetical protein